MKPEDPDKTIFPNRQKEQELDQMASALARFDRVLAGESIENQSLQELPSELDEKAGEFVEFLGLVEQALPRGEPVDEQPGVRNGSLEVACEEAPVDSRAETSVDSIASSIASTFSEEADSSDSTGCNGDSLIASGSDRPSAQESTEKDRAISTSPMGVPLPMRFGKFELLKQLGQGGYGVVYLAKDINLRRQVALKVPRRDTALSQDVYRRFVREARLSAVLDHPGIVKVYEAGEIEQVCYIASEYVPGTDLAAWLASRTTPVDQRQAVEIVIRLAEAVRHAHSQDILHRDIKPSNILLVTSQANEGRSQDENDVPQAGTLELSQFADPRVDGLSMKLCDFGLARMEQADRRDSILTRSGEMLGTPSYMAPEQITADKDISKATDIYGLGVVLYELLSGAVPFVGDNNIEVMHKVIEALPADPRKLRRDIAHDLVAICFKCLEKSPADRYQSASAMCDDLRRFLDGQVVSAKLPSLSQRMIRWAQQNSRLTIVAMATAVLLVAMVILVQSFNARHLETVNQELTGKKSELERLNSSLQAANESLERTQLELRQHLYMADMANASTAFRQHDNRTVRQLLQKHIPSGSAFDVRRSDWHLLNCLADPHNATALGRHTGFCDQVCITKDAKRAYSAGQDGKILGFDLETGKQIASWEYEAQIDTMSLSEDDRYLLTGLTVFGTPIQTILVLDLHSGEEKLRLPAHGYTICASAFSPNGELIATAGRNSSDRILVHTLSGERVLEMKSDSVIRSIAFSADSQSLIAPVQTEKGFSLRSISIKNPEQFRESLSCPLIAIFAISRAKSLMAIVDIAGGGVVLSPLDFEGEQIKKFLPCRGLVTGLAFSPGGDYLAVGTSDGQILVWGVSELMDIGHELSWPRVVCHEAAIKSIAFIPGSWPTGLVATASDGSVTRWDLNELYPQTLQMNDHGRVDQGLQDVNPTPIIVKGIVDMAVDPLSQEKQLALLSDGRLVRMGFDENPIGRLTTICQTNADHYGRLAVRDDSPMVAVSEPGRILLVSSVTGETIKRIGTPPTSFQCEALVFQDQKLYALFRNIFWSLDLQNMKIEADSIAPRINSAGVCCLLPIPSTPSILMLGCRKMYTLTSGQLDALATTFEGRADDSVAELSSDGKMLAIGDRNGQIALLDAERNWKLIDRFRVHAHQITDLQFLDNDRTLVSLSPFSQEISFSDVATRKPLGRVQAVQGSEKITSVQKGKSFISYSVNGSYIWSYEPAMRR